jgi:hypothetical protein
LSKRKSDSAPASFLTNPSQTIAFQFCPEKNSENFRILQSHNPLPAGCLQKKPEISIYKNPENWESGNVFEEFDHGFHGFHGCHEGLLKSGETANDPNDAKDPDGRRLQILFPSSIRRQKRRQKNGGKNIKLPPYKSATCSCFSPP